MSAQTPKPCGNYHPLPCGLDKECPVPVDYFDASNHNPSVVAWNAYQGEE